MADLDQPFRDVLLRALDRRGPLIRERRTQAYRVFSGSADGVDGIFIDVYDAGAVMILYEGRPPKGFNAKDAVAETLEVLRPLGVRAVYRKTFARDRSRMGGELPPETVDPTPAAGETLPEFLLVREIDWTIEVRLYDGLSTGLFLDQRENRAFVKTWIEARRRSIGKPPTMLNTFAYTCAFSIAAASGGALTASVDVSPRYLDWGKRNFAHNGINAVALAEHRFAKMDTFEFLNYARRKELTYDLIVLDPPSFGSGNKRKGIRPWSAIADYSRLIKESAERLTPGGVILASTNTQELCRPGRLEAEIERAVGRRAKWVELPKIGIDFERDRERFAAKAFSIS